MKQVEKYGLSAIEMLRELADAVGNDDCTRAANLFEAGLYARGVSFVAKAAQSEPKARVLYPMLLVYRFTKGPGGDRERVLSKCCSNPGAFAVRLDDCTVCNECGEKQGL